MRILAGARVWLRGTFRRTIVERELDEELRFHVDMATARNVRAGMPPAEARRRALVTFGGRERFKEEVRDARGGRALETMRRELRLALRALRRAPGFTVASVLSLAVGIGATTAVLALADGVLLRPLPYPAADRLVALRHAAPGFDVAEGGQSDGTFAHYAAHARSFEHAGVWFERVLTVTDGARPERLDAVLTTPGTMAALGARPLLGRAFSAADGAAGAPSVVLLAHDLWVRRYGADPAIVGRTIELNRRTREVVGVMPPDFRFPLPRTQLWFATSVEPERSGVRDLSLHGIARLRPGVRPEDAERELEALVPGLAARYGDVTRAELSRAGFQPLVVPLRDALTADVRPALLLVAAMAAFVLLVTWANVAGLGLVRAANRAGEAGLARALGASPLQVARPRLLECALLCLAGGGLALLVAQLALATRFGFAPHALPRLHELRLDARVAGIAAALTLGTGLLLAAVVVGLGAGTRVASAAPAAHGARVRGGREWQRAQRALVALQLGLSLVLLAGAATMAGSAHRLRSAQLGFHAADALVAEVALPVRQYRGYAENARFHATVLERARALPGVRGAEATNVLPLHPVEEWSIVAVRAEHAGPDGPTSERRATVAIASPGYFALMGMPLRAGRGFAAGDLRRERPAVVLGAALARALFPDGGVVGRTVRLGRSPLRYEIVGVVGDVPGATIAEGPAHTVYVPMLADAGASPADVPLPIYPREMTLVVRTAVPPLTLVPALRAIVRELDPQVPLDRVRTLDGIVDAATARPRLAAALLLAAALTAVGLGLVGVYGLVAYTVRLRRAELGVRQALGATPAGVVRLVLRQGAVVALCGIAGGVLAAAALARALRGLVHGVDPTDPWRLALTALALGGVALLAAWLPARSAARTSPAAALRAD